MLLVGFGAPASAQEQRRSSYAPPAAGTFHAVGAEHGMVVAQERIAAQIGADVLKRGGNAVDAAVATGFAMAVTYPRAGNIGGGGFMVIHSAERHEDVAIDYRETAPAAATKTMFLGPDGKPDAARSRDSALAIGVPGTVAGLALALADYGSGKFTMADILQPAIALAREGIVVADDSADTLPDWHRRLARWPASAKIFSRADGTTLREGDRLIQTDLATTLAAIAERGPDGFYQGPVAARLAKAVGDAGGILTADDLKDYRAITRPPLRGSYRGYDIVAMPQPSSGGVVLLEALNIIEGFPMHDMPQGSVASLLSARRSPRWSPRTMRRSSAPASTSIAPRHGATRFRQRHRMKAATPRISRWSTQPATRSATPIR
jgi:gamma-glutamyltranspeptidase/glutathione hydrolase